MCTCSWGKRAAHNRAQIVYYIAENLELRRSEVAGRIASMTGREEKACQQEVDQAIQRLFYWGAYADKYGGTVQVSRGTIRLPMSLVKFKTSSLEVKALWNLRIKDT